MKTKKILALALAAVLLVAVSVGGTIAYLTAKTGEVTNTFTPSNVSIELDETVPANKTAQMIPGATIAKDPDVTYTTNVPAYVFVKVTKSVNYDTYLEDYDVASGWNLLETTMEVDGIYTTVAVFYKEVTAGATDVAILDPEYVTVKDEVTNELMKALTADTYPTLSFQAYIIQKQSGSTDAGAAVNFTAAEAWTEVSK